MAHQARVSEDYILSLFAGRAIIPFRPIYNTISFQPSRGQGALTNRYWPPAQEVIAHESALPVAAEELLPEGVCDEIPESTKYLRWESKSNSPLKSPIKTLEEVEAEFSVKDVATPISSTADDSEDSFVEEIICRSPAKPVSRIEDSVEALDELEDAYEVSSIHVHLPTCRNLSEIWKLQSLISNPIYR